MQEQAESFPPIEGEHVHTLILGTVPGQASLTAAEYYAHPRNAFWPILIAIISGERPTYESARVMDYEARCNLLRTHGYAVWDVLAKCTRPGSLDSKIERSSEVANDIASLLTRHPKLQRIICNGKTAEKLFQRHMGNFLVPQNPPLENLPEVGLNTNLTIQCLPSTSPAMASLSLEDKFQIWADHLQA